MLYTYYIYLFVWNFPSNFLLRELFYISLQQKSGKTSSQRGCNPRPCPGESSDARGTLGLGAQLEQYWSVFEDVLSPSCPFSTPLDAIAVIHYFSSFCLRCCPTPILSFHGISNAFMYTHLYICFPSSAYPFVYIHWCSWYTLSTSLQCARSELTGGAFTSLPCSSVSPAPLFLKDGVDVLSSIVYS